MVCAMYGSQVFSQEVKSESIYWILNPSDNPGYAHGWYLAILAFYFWYTVLQIQNGSYLVSHGIW